MTDAERDFLRDLRRVMKEHGVKLRENYDDPTMIDWYFKDAPGEIDLTIETIYDELNP